MELALVLLGTGIAFLLVAFVLVFVSKNKQRKCTVSTEAVVVDFKVIIKENNYYYHPIYEYAVEGIQYKKTASALSGRTPEINTFVPIMYNPHNPQQSYIQGYDNKAYNILAVVFAAIGCIPIVIYICVVLLS